MAAKNNALNKPVNVSPALEAVVGKGPLTRAEVTSKVWAYIKANGLQDSVNKRNINPDAKRVVHAQLEPALSLLTGSSAPMRSRGSRS